MTELSTPLVAALGARAAELLAAQLSLHTVGDLLRHYPRRYVDRGRLTDIAGLEIGEHITVVAQVEKATLRDMRSRNGKLLAVVIRDEKGAELDCTFFNGHKLKSLVKPGVRAVFSGKVGVFNQQAAAHPPAVRDPRRRRRDPPLHLRLPGHRQARLPGDRPVGAPGARHGRRRSPIRCRPRCARGRAWPS